jgi:hypothetical protein
LSAVFEVLKPAAKRAIQRCDDLGQRVSVTPREGTTISAGAGQAEIGEFR